MRLTEALGAALPRRQVQPDEDATLQREVFPERSAQHFARRLAEARGIRCVEVDLHVLRGEREPELTLFA